MKLKLLILNFSFLILSSCASNRPVATTHTERIEQHVMPVAVGADTIIIESVFSAGEATASSVSSVRNKNSVRDKNSSVRNKNSEGVKSVQIRRAKIANKRGQRSFLRLPSRSNFNGVKSCAARERIEEKKELKNQSDLCNLWETTHSEGVNSVSSVRDKNSSVRNKNSVRISSTRGVNISRHETDTSTRIRLTLRPDTVFVPYTNHIRSDTIVVPDRVCQQKLNRSNMTNLFLILILIVIIIIFLKNRMTR